MPRFTGTMLLTAVAALALAAPSHAAGLKEVGQIVMPGEKLDSFDISFVDPTTNQLFIADRSNKAIDVLDAKTDKYLTRITGFVGDGPKGDLSGPNGVVTANNSSEVWAGDGDSTVKVIDLKAGKIVDTIKTGGKMRADEIAYDPKEGIIAIVNDADEPPFITLISTKPGHKILAKLVYDQASDGIEQPQYNAATGLFYVDLPEINKQKGKGGLIVINPKTLKNEKVIPVDNCTPHGQATGPGTHVFLACNAGNVKDKQTGRMVVIDVKSGKEVASIQGAGGSDEGWANNNIGQYYAATANDSAGPALTVIDAKANKIVQKVKTAVGAHSIAASLYNNHVYLPERASNGCGCIMVFSPEM